MFFLLKKRDLVKFSSFVFFGLVWLGLAVCLVFVLLFHWVVHLQARKRQTAKAAQTCARSAGAAQRHFWSIKIQFCRDSSSGKLGSQLSLIFSGLSVAEKG